MVVCNPSLMPMPQVACPVPPATLHPFTTAVCPLSPVSALPCSQRFPPTTLLASSGQMYAATTPMPCVQGLSTSSVIQCSQTPSPQTSPNSTESTPDNASVTCNVVASNCNGVVTYTPVTSNLMSITNSLPTIYPYNHTNLVQCKLPSNQNNNAGSNVIQCNQGIYGCTQPTPTIVPCQQRIVNGTSVLQCTPGVCQIAPTAVYPTGTVMCPMKTDMCPVSSTTVIPNTTAVYPVSPPITQNICTATPASSWKQSYGMEQVWQCEFRTLFLQYAPHVWMLVPVTQKPTGIWHSNVDSAKVRFCCEDCGHGWTSMKGRVAFWFILNPATNEGMVCLKLYGQQCDRCKTGNYEPAMWYPEEVLKVLVNIYNRVGQVYYGFQQAPYHKARRPGKPRTPHNSDLCQACKDGVCAERR